MRTSIASLLLVLASTTAFAQADGTPPGTPPPDAAPAAPQSSPEADSARARAEFVAGMQAYEEHRYHDAIAAFRRASEIVPSADLWFNIARSYEELGEIDAAIENYRRYLRDRVDPPDRARVEEHIEQLEERAEVERLRARQTPTTGTLRIDVSVAGATVLVDDAEIGTSPIPIPLSFAAGDHVVEVRHDGFIPFRSRVHVDAGSSVIAIASLVPSTEYRAVRGKRRFTWLMAGLAGASLATSIGLGIHAFTLNRDGDLAEARRWARYSDYAAGGTMAFGLGTVLLYFSEGRSVRTERVD